MPADDSFLLTFNMAQATARRAAQGAHGPSQSSARRLRGVGFATITHGGLHCRQLPAQRRPCRPMQSVALEPEASLNWL